MENLVESISLHGFVQEQHEKMRTINKIPNPIDPTSLAADVKLQKRLKTSNDMKPILDKINTKSIAEQILRFKNDEEGGRAPDEIHADENDDDDDDDDTPARRFQDDPDFARQLKAVETYLEAKSSDAFGFIVWLKTKEVNGNLINYQGLLPDAIIPVICCASNWQTKSWRKSWRVEDPTQ
jgi:hypothetical protein